MTGSTILELDSSDFVEIDPSGRYGRYNEILGKGASKTVYKAFDEYEGIEVAWNQVKLYDFLQSSEDLERLYCEIHLLKTLKHENIMKFYNSWVDTANRNINFVTEMFTSGTLRQYRLKHRRVNIRAVKHWCRQILKGLLYLHSHNPPVIHRDLKCDNIFVNGNTGEVKIGDLGLAAILKKSYAARCVGTPEFMAPEVYEEEYNELVDIYSFGMCLLEMVTLEYPYSECNHPAQIYKKVVSGKKPAALYKVEDPELREFVEKCLASVSSRLSARELLEDPFLRINDYGSDFRALECHSDSNQLNPLVRQPCYGIDPENELEYRQLEFRPSEFDLFSCQEDGHLENVNISIKGRRSEDDGIFLRLRIADDEGRIRNIYFPFDVENDTALSVAAEMVSELDMTDQDVLKIAEMIDSEIATLVPEWEKGQQKDEIQHDTNSNSNSNLCNQIDDNAPFENPKVTQCSKHESATHGRFEEFTYQEPKEIHCDEGQDRTTNSEKEDRVVNSVSSHSVSYTHWDDYENEIRQELRWLKAKYQMQLRELKDQKLRVKLDSSGVDRDSVNGVSFNSIFPKAKREKYKPTLESLLSGKNFTSDFPLDTDVLSPEQMFTAKTYYTESLIPCSLHRATSLPVDALDV